MSWLLWPKSSANVSLPLGPSKTYGLSTFSHGSARRCRLSSSRSRVNSFSLASNAVRAESHSSRETTRWSLRLLLPLFVRHSPLLALCAIVVGDNHERSCMAFPSLRGQGRDHLQQERACGVSPVFFNP